MSLKFSVCFSFIISSDEVTFTLSVWVFCVSLVLK